MTADECPCCGPLTEAGTYRDAGDPPRARYCRRCGRPVVGADLSRDDTADRTFTLTVQLDGAAFDDPGELPRVIRYVADRVEYNTRGPLRDINGNRCGSWSFSDEATT